MVQITPHGAEAPLIEFDIVGVGKFHLPVLGEPGVPLGITSAFGVFEGAQTDEQKLTAWTYMINALSDSYPSAVRVLGRLGSETVADVFTSWREQSEGYDPKAQSSVPSSTGTDDRSSSTSDESASS